MGKVVENINEALQEWIEQQPVFFVATAPTEGHINLSPKGYDSLRILDPLTVVYLDLTGSAAETIAHVTQNRKITFMWCAFAGKPKIVRAYGEAKVHLLGSEGFDSRYGLFEDTPGARSIIECNVSRVSTSCGFSVPEYTFEQERPTLKTWATKKGPEGLEQYHTDRNQKSIDGLPTNLG